LSHHNLLGWKFVVFIGKLQLLDLLIFWPTTPLFFCGFVTF